MYLTLTIHRSLHCPDIARGYTYYMYMYVYAPDLEDLINLDRPTSMTDH